MEKTKISLHAATDRNERITQILLNVGMGQEIARGQIDEWAYGVATSTGVYQIYNIDTDALITMYLFSPKQAKEFFQKIGKEIPQSFLRKVKENRNKLAHLYTI